MAGSETATSRGARGRASIGGPDQTHNPLGSATSFEHQQRQFVQQQQQQQQQQQNSRQHLHQDQRQCPSDQFARDEIDIAFNRLMALEAFRRLHPSLIRNLCSYASIERIEKGVLVFRQGDDAINWYALLEGSVDVKVAQSSSGQETTAATNSAHREQQQGQATTLTSGVGGTRDGQQPKLARPAMFSSHSLKPLANLRLGHKTSGSYEVNRESLASPEVDENNNIIQELPQSCDVSLKSKPVRDQRQLANLEKQQQQQFQVFSVAGDFNQNQAKRLKKLRSISFSRFVYLKSASQSYDIRTPRPAATVGEQTDQRLIRAKSTNANDLNTQTNNLNAPRRLNSLRNWGNTTTTTTTMGTGEQDGVTLCTLGVGTTFGASVMPGKSHNVSVVTNEECTLLRVRRADFQEIFNEQLHLISDVESSPFFPLSTLNKISQSSDSGALTRIRSSISSSLSKFAPATAGLVSVGGPGSSSPPVGRLRRLGSQAGFNSQLGRVQLASDPSQRQQRPATTDGGKPLRQQHQQHQQEGRRSSLMASAQQVDLQLSHESIATSKQVALVETGAVSQQSSQQSAFQSPIHSDGPCDRSQVAGEHEQQQELEEAEEEEDVQGDGLEGDLNLDSLDASELSSQLMRIGWVLRTLILTETPRMIKDRRVYPNLHHSLLNSPAALQANSQQQQMSGTAKSSKSRAPIKSAMGRHLVPMGSSSHLFAGSSSSSSAPAVGTVPPATQTASSSSSKSVASSAGRKVANYVAASFMRTAVGKPTASAAATSSSTQQAKQPLANGRHPQQPLYSASGSFDQHPSTSTRDHSSNHHHHQHHHQHHNHLHADHLSQEPVQLRQCLVGREMVDWLLQLSLTNTNAGRFVSSRLQAVSMWQVLLEQEIILSVPLDPKTRSPAEDEPQATSAVRQHQQATANKQAQFCDDSQAFYKFYFDCDQEQEEECRDQTAGTDASQSRSPSPPSQSDVALANETLWWSLKLLSKLAPDACFRLILARHPHERSGEEVDIVFEELQHLKALSHLTNSVKKQLAACVQSEHHARQNTVIFNQGDTGHSWYIILRGSVNVVIVGKGVVCTLHDGDDFGKLALVNDAPRAATIVTNEPNCYFLRVDKHDFNTILRDVEANTVRLKEHGKEVLILQKVAIKEQQQPQTTTTTIDQNHLGGPGSGQLGPTTAPSSATNSNTSSSGAINNLGVLAEPQANNNLSLAGQQQQTQVAEQVSSSAGQQQVATTAAVAVAVAAATSSQCALKYMVMAGTAEKMLEHLLETRIDGQTQTAPLALAKQALCQHDQVANYIQCQGDNFLEDFILTHKIFMPTESLCQELLKQYQSSGSQQQQQQAKQQPVSRQINNLDDEYLVAKKRRVIKFVRFWMLVNREHFFQQQQIQNFVMTLHQKVKLDAQRFGSLQPELKAISRIYELQLEENLESRHRGCQRWIEDIYGNFLPIRRHSGTWQAPPGSSSGPPIEMGAGSEPGLQQAFGNPQNLAASEHFLVSLHSRRFEHKLSTIQPEDELVFRVYCADHSYTTLKCRFDEQAGQIKQVAARNLKLADKELILVHVKSNGERIIYNDLEANICTCLSVNGRLFVCPLDHIDAVSPLPEQDPFQEVYQSLVSNVRQQQQQNAVVDGENSLTSSGGGPSTASSGQQQQQQALTSSANYQQENQTVVQQPISSHLLAATPTNYADIKLQMSLSVAKLEEFSSRDIAYCLTQLAWSLLKNMHEFELVYTVFGRNNFKQITANLNVFLRHFNEIQYWVVTQICLSQPLSKRVQILRKFIKVAAHCKEMQNLNAFFAIIMGLSNMAVARLTQTWERLPSKLKRTFSQFESQIDPSRNHRRYRIYLSKLEPPIVPFMPLFLKDMTFAHEGNKTHLENGLINFEKMQMIAQTLRTIRYCKSRSMKLDPSLCKFKSSIRSIELFFRDLKMIDNQRTLTQMSHQLEHRKT